MKGRIAVWLVLLTCAVGTISWGVCPEEPFDRGECDTMYVEPWPADTLLEGDPPYFVRVLIYVTNDVHDINDSICSMCIPLSYNRSNPSKYCSLSYHWNTQGMLPIEPLLERSIFRHLVEGDDTIYHNRMAVMASDWSGREWDSHILDLDGTSLFRLSMSPTGTPDQLWWEGSRVLLATMTFKLEDSMRVCIDTCFWPPSCGLYWCVLSEVGGDVVPKIPRPGTPPGAGYETCFNVIPFLRGDANGDGVVEVGDVVYLINYLYRDGDPPVPTEDGDANCDGVVDVGDVVYLINYLYRDGDPPGCPYTP
ncbi:MAG: dockerin type I domain-containing protein [Candidatus Zixiibacteriota bacterium]